ncbi:GNAT family N-acetyltransferase [Actinomadura sp. ATCC 31491]|uniref:GNAT family N-acetyltransferase n=1 Tax=Actinomadura luzonensis TaxID=2805427 RepID=A0ABT0FQ05_9ACTN|nr:GNAT family N-acetyltransferase [Actinomadura luzonensis]MCK2214364.1 GNAT family N-acetyltransferase [Actinomadura luzonensis]
MEWGPLTREDARPLAELLHAMEAADRTGVVHGVDEVAGHLDSPLLDLAAGTLAARDGDRIVAFGHLPVMQSAAETHTMRFWGGVHPAHRRRGLGRRVVDWSLGAAPGLSARAFPGVPAEVHLSADESDPGAVALAEAAGFVPVRTFARMTRPLAGDLPPVRPPAGVSLVPWSPEVDDGAREVRNQSFRDHWGSVPHTPQSWRSAITGSPSFLPDASFVALAGEQAVGALLTHRRDTPDGERVAWIQIVGTLKEWRGKGVAGSLLAHALAAFAAQGYDSAGLGVDADNPTGAVAVYQRAGFSIARRSTAYAYKVA